MIEKIKSEMAADESSIDEELWDENRRAWYLFMRVSTQWMYSASGDRIGLNYQSVESAMNMLNISKPKRRQLFEDLQLIEFTVIGLFDAMEIDA